MFKNFFYTSILLVILSIFFCQAQKPHKTQSSYETKKPYSVNIVGFIDDNISLSRHASAFINCLYKDVPLNLIKSRKTSVKQVPEHLKDIINQSIDLTSKNALRGFLKKGFELDGVTIFTDGPLMSWKEYTSLPNKSVLKIIYAVTERSVIPQNWVVKMNQNFDAIVVPDGWMIDIFKQSGISLPIFVLPLVLDNNLRSFLNLPPKQSCNQPFVFGMTGGFTPRKNHALILRAFAEEFGNNPNFKLKLHGAYGADKPKLLDILKHYNLTNVEISQITYPRSDYEKFIRSLDCYAFASKGEGFSITPREAMAAGIPCILSDNTAHKIICQSGFVCPIQSNIVEPAYFVTIQKYLGNDFNCDIQDVRKAMRHVYQNYNQYLSLASHGREWVKQYLAKNLAPLYLSLVKPKLVILGHENLITNEYLMTNSKELYAKYQKLCTQTNTVFTVTPTAN